MGDTYLYTRWCPVCRDYKPPHEHTDMGEGLLDALSATDPEDRFDGGTYEADIDAARLTRQADDVFRLMRDGEWRTLAAVAKSTGHPEASVSARLRDLRKPRFGEHTVERRRGDWNRGTFEYRLIPNTDMLDALKAAAEGGDDATATQGTEGTGDADTDG